MRVRPSPLCLAPALLMAHDSRGKYRNRIGFWFYRLREGSAFFTELMRISHLSTWILATSYTLCNGRNMLENCLDSCSRHAAFVASATKFDLRDKAGSCATGSIYLCALIATVMFLCISSNHLRPAWQVRYIGLSNETTYGVCEFARAAAAAGLPAPVSIQNSYSLLARVLFEADLAEACAPHHHNLGAHYPNPQIDYDLHLVFCDISSAYVHTYDTNMSVLDSHSPHSYTTNRNATSTMLPEQRLLGVHARTRLTAAFMTAFKSCKARSIVTG